MKTTSQIPSTSVTLKGNRFEDAHQAPVLTDKRGHPINRIAITFSVATAACSVGVLEVQADMSTVQTQTSCSTCLLWSPSPERDELKTDRISAGGCETDSPWNVEPHKSL